MGYISKELVLKSYQTLSSLTEDHKQGQTQIVSAIRHLFALDMFYKQEQVDCDLNNTKHRDAFVENVKKIVTVKDEYYTTNFYTTIKPLEDCGVGSNFTSAGVVNNSKQNTVQLYDYPTRGQHPLFNVRNAKAIRNTSYYKNIKHYLYSESIRSAFVIWVLRNEYIRELSPSYLRNKLKSYFTEELIDGFFPKEENLFTFTEGYSVVSDKYQTECDDLLSLFGVTNKCQAIDSKYRPYITAIKSKPFLLLAGISGTGKSRIVRELARACWNPSSEEYKAQKPRNFEMVQVKPNWHDSSELIGYVSRVSGAHFVAGDFLKFVARAWEEPEVPYFLCLDEMNLAPVEQYFAEYLSVVESRKVQEDGKIVTDPVLRKNADEWYFDLCAALTDDDNLRQQFLNQGICIPQNLIVVGTVNMDETTFSFSRKVLDRAMTIEMNEVDLYGGLTTRHEQIGKLGTTELIGTAVEGVDVYTAHQVECDTALGYLGAVNDQLEGTPFKIAYRTRNEFLLYVVNNLPYNKDEEDNELSQDYVIARALDEITSMKILSRIEGDETKVSKDFLKGLSNTIKEQLETVSADYDTEKSISLKKLEEMQKRLDGGYTGFWS